MIDLRISALRSFVAVAETLHFGRAARSLSLGQSAVSQHVRRLELGLGAELFTRTSRTVALTAAGERLLPAARAIVRDADRAAADVRAVAAGELGTLRVAAQQAARVLIVPGVLGRLVRDLPGLTIEVLPLTTAEGLAAVAEGAADVAFVRDPSPREGLVIESLAVDPIMIALARDHRLAGRDTLELGALRGERWVGWNRVGAPDYFDRIAELMGRAGLEPRPFIELRGVDTRLGAVAAGLGYALESGAYGWLFGDRVRFVSITGQPLTGEIVAAWPALSAAPALPRVLDAARAAAAALSAAGAGR